MPKAEPLNIDTLGAPQITPKAATPARSPALSGSQSKVEQVPLQIRIPRHEARAIKIAAAEQEQTISEFMLACFHAYMKLGKRGNV
jgi:hypothetical protein